MSGDEAGSASFADLAGARAEALRPTAACVPAHPWPEGHRAAHRDPPDEYLVNVEGVTAGFHFRITVVEQIVPGAGCRVPGNPSLSRSVIRMIGPRAFPWFPGVREKPSKRRNELVPLGTQLASSGAGDENRTRMTSLEGWGSTIELRPRGIGALEFPLDSLSRRR